MFRDDPNQRQIAVQVPTEDPGAHRAWLGEVLVDDQTEVAHRAGLAVGRRVAIRLPVIGVITFGKTSPELPRV